MEHVTFGKPQVNSIGHEKERLVVGGKMKGKLAMEAEVISDAEITNAG